MFNYKPSEYFFTIKWHSSYETKHIFTLKDWIELYNESVKKKFNNLYSN
jgi:hypothetical protein